MSPKLSIASHLPQKSRLSVPQPRYCNRKTSVTKTGTGLWNSQCSVLLEEEWRCGRSCLETSRMSAVRYVGVVEEASDWCTSSGVTRLQWARVQVFQKGPLFPKKKLFKNSVGQILGPHSAGPACTARLARHIVTPLCTRHAVLNSTRLWTGGSQCS